MLSRAACFLAATEGGQSRSSRLGLLGTVAIHVIGSSTASPSLEACYPQGPARKLLDYAQARAPLCSCPCWVLGLLASIPNSATWGKSQPLCASLLLAEALKRSEPWADSLLQKGLLLLQMGCGTPSTDLLLCRSAI